MAYAKADRVDCPPRATADHLEFVNESGQPADITGRRDLKVSCQIHETSRDGRRGSDTEPQLCQPPAHRPWRLLAGDGIWLAPTCLAMPRSTAPVAAS